MKRFSEQFKKQASTVKLRAAERRDLRERLVAYMEYHPLPQQSAPVVPSTIVSEPLHIISFNWWRLGQWSGATALMLLVVIPLLAERAMPGDVLYAVKVQFNEEVRSTLSLTPAERVAWETARLNRRIAEARLLASEGRLTPAMEVQVAEAVRTHTENAEKEIATLRTTDEEEASLVALELATTLAVQASGFAADEAATDEMITLMATTEQVTPNVIADAIAVAQANKTTEYSSTTVPRYEKLVARVEMHTTRLYEGFQTLAPQLTATDAADITRRMSDIERAIGEAFVLAETDELAARFALVAVLERSQRLLVFMSNLDVRTTMPLEEVVPVEYTDEELQGQLTEQLARLTERLAQIDTLLPRVTDENRVAKVTYARAELETEYAALTATPPVALDDALAQVAAALVLADDTLAMLDTTDLLPVVTIDTASTSATTSPEVATTTATTTTPDSAEEDVVESEAEPATDAPSTESVDSVE
jgi:hypothetical protein